VKKNWFYRKSSIKKLCAYSLIILIVVFFVEYFIFLYPHFDIERLFGFYAFLGFLSCIALIIFAKLFGILIKRKDDYYDL